MSDSWQRTEATWMREGRWGVFHHWLADQASAAAPTAMTADAWNRRVDACAVDGLAEQLAACGAAWHVLTLGQNSGFYCSPNAAYQAIVADDPCRCARRDLLADMAGANARHGIRQMAYFTTSAPCNHVRAMERLGCTPADPALARRLGLDPARYAVQPDIDARMSRFQRHWETVIREWSLRWGRTVSGWWLDGCYAADVLYRHPDAPNFRSLAQALKAGNPDSLIAFNSGLSSEVRSQTEYEDYTPGELNQPSVSDFQWHDQSRLPGQPYRATIDGAQFHVLTFLGYWWGAGAPRMSKELAAAYTRHVVERGGAITWDVPITEAGRVPDPYPDYLAAIGAAARAAETIG